MSPQEKERGCKEILAYSYRKTIFEFIMSEHYKDTLLVCYNIYKQMNATLLRYGTVLLCMNCMFEKYGRGQI